MLNPRKLVRHLAQVRAEPLPPLDWDVEPLFARGDRVVLYGDFGALKSWALLDLALHLAAGRDWLGHRVPRPRRVLYVDEEMPERVLYRRVTRLAAGAGIADDAPLGLLSRAGFQFTRADVQALIRAVPGAPPEVYVIETLARTLVGDEAHNAHVAELWRRVEELVSTGATVVISHHMSKPPSEGVLHVRYRARGATDFLAGCDVAVAMEATQPNRSRMRVIKNREARLGHPVSLEIVDVGPHDTCTKEAHHCPARVQVLHGAAGASPRRSEEQRQE